MRFLLDGDASHDGSHGDSGSALSHLQLGGALPTRPFAEATLGSDTVLPFACVPREATVTRIRPTDHSILYSCLRPPLKAQSPLFL